MRYALIGPAVDGIASVFNVVEFDDPITEWHGYTAVEDTDDRAEPSGTYDVATQVFTPPAPVSPRYTAPQFLLLLTSDERTAVRSSAVPAVEDWLFVMNNPGTQLVDTGMLDTQKGIACLVANNVLTPARAASIMQGAVPTTVLPTAADAAAKATALTFAKVPDSVVPGMLVRDAAGAIPDPTTVVSVTATAVTLSNGVNPKIPSGTQISFW